MLCTAILGLVIGAVAKLLMPGKDPGGFVITMLLGLAGSYVAAYLGQLIGWYKEGQPTCLEGYSFYICNGSARARKLLEQLVPEVTT